MTGIENDCGTEVSAGTLPDQINVGLRRFARGLLRRREYAEVCEGDSTGHGSCGWDVQLLGDPDDPTEIGYDTRPDCYRNGAHRVLDESAVPSLYTEPAPRIQTHCATTGLVSALMPDGKADEETCIGSVSLKVTAGCYPLVVVPKVTVCGARFGTQTVSVGDPAVDVPVPPPAWWVHKVDDDECAATAAGGTVELGPVTIEPGETRKMTAEVCVRLWGDSNQFEFEGGQLRFCVDVREQTGNTDSLLEDC